MHPLGNHGPGSDEPNNRRGKPMRLFPVLDASEIREGGKVSKNILTSIATRLWAKVDRSPGQGPEATCWQWTGGTHEFGYGVIGRGRQTEGTTKTHRVAWEDTYGPIPDGLNVLHRCDNPPCCNPSHLFLGTQQDNVDDARAKGRTTPPPPHCGEDQHLSKLQGRQVKRIRRIYKARDPKYGANALACHYGVTRQTIQNAVRGFTWKHLLPQETI